MVEANGQESVAVPLIDTLTDEEEQATASPDGTALPERTTVPAKLVLTRVTVTLTLVWPLFRSEPTAEML